MLDKIIRQLGDNYDVNDNQVLLDLIDEATYSALSFTNRTEIDYDMENIIKRYVIAKYLQRGGEGSTSTNELGKSASFYDPLEKMKTELINEGKRKIC